MRPSEVPPAVSARIEWQRTAVLDEYHNAVTDLVRWRGRWWLAYRRGAGHHAPPAGVVRVLVSDDLERWTLAVALARGEHDGRDPKLTALEDRLLCTFGAAHETWGERDGRRAVVARAMSTEVAWTEDGERWTQPRTALERGWWLWGVGAVRGGLLGVAYGDGRAEASANRCVELFASERGESWEPRARLLDGFRGTEGTLVEVAPERAVALVRGERDDEEGAHLFVGEEPWTSWRNERVPHALHAPALAVVGEHLIAAGRGRDAEGRWRTQLWLVQVGGGGGPTRELLTLPSGGDNSYPGLVADGPDALVVSWYSQHEFLERPGFVVGGAPAAVYLARVRLG